MKIDRIIRNLRVLWRADSIIADIRARHLVARSGLRALAALIAVFGLLMLGIAAYFALEQLWGRIWAATAVGLGDIAVALVLLVIAARLKPGRDIDLAMEVHKSAMEALLADSRDAEAEFAAFTSAFQHPFDSALPGLIIPLATMLLKNLKRPAKPRDA